MRKVLQSFLLFVSAATDRELARMVEFLKAENQMLRSRLPKRIAVTAPERNRLLKLGKTLGAKDKGLISIVSYRTFTRWLNRDKQRPVAPAKRGRKPTPAQIKELILTLAASNGWGYTRILGELKKLGFHKISRSTVKNILKENGFDPGPKRGEGTWSDFIRRHAATLYACDFFTTKVITLRGVVDVFVLFFIHVESRRVHLGGMTAHPDAPWMKQQARNLSMHFDEQPVKPTMLLRDLDGKFCKEFDTLLEADGVKIQKVGPRSPNLNPHAERFVQSVRREALDHFVVLGEAHLRHIIISYVNWYNSKRPHQGKNNEPLTGSRADEVETLSLADICCEEQLGGVLKHYARKAA